MSQYVGFSSLVAPLGLTLRNIGRTNPPKRDADHGSPWPVLANHTTSRARTRTIREMAMKKNLILAAMILLATLWFALDAGVEAMILFS